MRMFNIPNLLTATNMLCGVAAVLLAFAGRIDIAPFFVFLAAVLDFFDGFAARLLKQQGELGKQLDSLADMISFGLAPGIITMYLLILGSGVGGEISEFLGETNAAQMMQGGNIVPVFYVWMLNILSWSKPNLLPLVALAIPFFSMFRLAKFNIDTRQSESFIGLPTPANSIFFMAFPLLLAQYANATGWEHGLIMWLLKPAVLIAIVLVMSLLLIAELPLFALKFKSFGWRGNGMRYGFLITCAILIPFMLFWSIPIIILLYLLLSVINNVRSGRATKQNA